MTLAARINQNAKNWLKENITKTKPAPQVQEQAQIKFNEAIRWLKIDLEEYRDTSNIFKATHSWVLKAPF